ncbi:MAG: GNAT family N-acetyltransferase [Candidatus Dormibacteria bacterium]
MIRRAGRADARAVAAILAEFQDVFGEPRPDDVAMRSGVERLLAGGDAEYFLAGEPVVGVAALRFRWSLISQADDAYLEELYVRESHRRRGLGRSLMEACFARVRERGGSYLELGVDGGDREAIAFYEALGFTDRSGGPDGPPVRVYARWVGEPPPWERGTWPL